jgi:DNA-binding response OmpR family regulator
MSGNILVVEDDNYLRDFVAGRLDKAGFKSEKACNGEEALHLLKKGYFDLIVMDLELGDMNGKDIILLIRKQSIDIPIIVMSTFNNLNVKLDSFGVGCDDYVTKTLLYR